MSVENRVAAVAIATVFISRSKDDHISRRLAFHKFNPFLQICLNGAAYTHEGYLRKSDFSNFSKKCLDNKANPDMFLVKFTNNRDSWQYSFTSNPPMVQKALPLL